MFDGPPDGADDKLDAHISQKMDYLSFLYSISRESIYYGLCIVNLIYLSLFVFLCFIMFRYLSNSTSYYLATIFASLGTLYLSELKYGHID